MSDTIVINTETQAFNHQTDFKCSGYGLGSMVQNMDGPKVLEIGCDIGDTTEFLLNSNRGLQLTGIDPYQNYVDWNGRPLDDRDYIHDRFMKRMKRYNNRFKLYRDYSDNIFNQFEDEYFDVIFIDGLHTYEQLTKDCRNYYSKLKTGGVFSGHDYNAIAGVRQAANEFAELKQKQILMTDCDVWYWIK